MIWKFCLYGFLKNLRFFEPFLYLFFLEKGLNFSHIGLLISIREISIYIFEIPTGILADLIGRRKVMIYCFIAYLISFAMFFISAKFLLFAIAMVIFALGEALRSGTHKSIIFDYLDKNKLADQKIRYYGKTRSFSKLGSALNAIIAALLVFYRNKYEIIFAAAIIPYIIDLVLMISYPKYLDRKLPPNYLKIIWHDSITHIAGIFNDFKSVRNLRKSIFNSAIYDAMFKVTKDYLQPIVKSWVLLLPIFLWVTHKQRTAILIGIVYFIINLLSAYASRNAYKIQAKFPISASVINALFFINTGLFLVSFIFIKFNLYIPIVMIFALFYILKNIRRPYLVGFIGDIMNKEIRATVFSIETQFRAIFAILIAPLIGYFADNFGLSSIFLVAFAIMALSSTFVYIKQ